MFPAKFHHALVDIDQDDLFDGFMLQHFVSDGQIAAAHDHHVLGPAVLQERQVNQHLGIG